LRAKGFSKVFIGWFGPRGIASILYLLIIVGDLGKDTPIHQFQ